jgi:hypothetical protein
MHRRVSTTPTRSKIQWNHYLSHLLSRLLRRLLCRLLSHVPVGVGAGEGGGGSAGAALHRLRRAREALLQLADHGAEEIGRLVADHRTWGFGSL